MHTIEGTGTKYPYLLPIFMPGAGRPGPQRHEQFSTVGLELYAALCVCNIRPWAIYDIRLHLMRRCALAETIWSSLLAHFGFGEPAEWRWGSLEQIAPSRVLYPEQGNTALYRVRPDNDAFEDFTTEIPDTAAKLLSICEWRNTQSVTFRTAFLGDGSSDYVLWAYDKRATPAMLAVLAWNRDGIVEPPAYWGAR